MSTVKLITEDMMKRNQIAAQLYTLRDYCKTADDFVQTCKKVKAIGYEAVQVSGVGLSDFVEIKRVLDGEGLICAATHEGGDDICNKTETVIEKLKLYNCKYTAYPYPGGINMRNLDEVMKLAKDLNTAGKKLYDAGLVLCYHNHHVEFAKHGNKTVLDILFDETDPKYLQGEPDTYWVQFGGGEPTYWCEKLKNRLPLLHLKDYVLDQDMKPTFSEIGNGTLDWKRILPTAEASGCEWYIVEQDVCPGDPFDSLKMSFDYLVSAFNL